jgi:hypothetical protein
MSALFDDNFDAQGLTGQYGAKLAQYPGTHKFKIKAFAPLQRATGIGVDGELIASTNGRLQPGSQVGLALIKGKFPEYFSSACKRLIGLAMGQDPEKVKKEHVQKIAAAKGKQIADKVITVEVGPLRKDGYGNVNYVGGADFKVTQAAEGTGTGPDEAAESASDPDVDLDDDDDIAF